MKIILNYFSCWLIISVKLFNWISIQMNGVQFGMAIKLWNKDEKLCSSGIAPLERSKPRAANNIRIFLWSIETKRFEFRRQSRREHEELSLCPQAHHHFGPDFCRFSSQRCQVHQRNWTKVRKIYLHFYITYTFSRVHQKFFYIFKA